MKARILSLIVILTMLLSACAQATPTNVATEPPQEPTQAPLPTDKPTQAPAPTEEPTQAPEPTVAPTEEVKEPVELRMMWYDDGQEGAVMRSLLDQFQEEYPHITVVMDTVAYQDLHTILQTAVEGGDAPDLTRLTDVSRFRTHYLDLRPYLSDPDAWEAEWPEMVMTSMRMPDDTTGLYGFPTQFTVTGPFINRTLFEQAGVPVPSDTSDQVTWDEWVAAATEVAELTETPYAVAIDRTGHRFWGPAISNGATFIDPATGHFSAVDTPGFRQTAQMIVDWHDQNITPAEVWKGAGGTYASGKDYFVQGQLVLYMSGSWQVGGFASGIGDTFDWEVIPNPCGSAGCSGIPGGALLMGLQGTEHPEEVALLIEWLTQDEVLAEFSAQSMFIPGKLSLIEAGIEYPTASEAMNVFMAQIPLLLPEAYLLQYHPQGFVLNTEIRDRLSQVLVGELTLDEAIAKIQEKVDEVNATLP